MLTTTPAIDANHPSLSLESLKHELTTVIRELHQQGMTPATSSNFSARLPSSDNFMISISGKDKGEWTAEDFITVANDGSVLDVTQEKRKPSAETLLHGLIYRHQPEANVILHVHAPNSTIISKLCEKQGKVTLKDFELLKGLSGITTHETEVSIPVFPNSQDMTKLAQDIDIFWQATPIAYGFLLAGHGLYTWGNSIATTKRHVETLENLFGYELELKRYATA